MALEQVFFDPNALKRFRAGPLASELDGFCEWLSKHVFMRCTIRRHISKVSHFSLYLEQKKLTNPTSFNSDHIRRFITEHLPHCKYRRPGTPITRFGITYIITKYADKATVRCPTLNQKTVGPHTFRHSTAMHLIQAGNDINMVRLWIGHADINTTHIYVEIDMEMKQKILSTSRPPQSYKKRLKTQSGRIRIYSNGWMTSPRGLPPKGLLLRYGAFGVKNYVELIFVQNQLYLHLISQNGVYST